METIPTKSSPPELASLSVAHPPPLHLPVVPGDQGSIDWGRRSLDNYFSRTISKSSYASQIPHGILSGNCGTSWGPPPKNCTVPYLLYIATDKSVNKSFEHKFSVSDPHMFTSQIRIQLWLNTILCPNSSTRIRFLHLRYYTVAT